MLAEPSAKSMRSSSSTPAPARSPSYLIAKLALLSRGPPSAAANGRCSAAVSVSRACAICPATAVIVCPVSLNPRSASERRAVGAEAPLVAFEVARRVATPAVVVVVRRQRDLGAGGGRAGVVRVRIGDEDVRRPLAQAGIGVTQAAEHQHAVAQLQLGVGDGALRPRHQQQLLEAERPLQPGDGRRGIAVGKTGIERRHMIRRWPCHGCAPPAGRGAGAPRGVTTLQRRRTYVLNSYVE